MMLEPGDLPSVRYRMLSPDHELLIVLFYLTKIYGSAFWMADFPYSAGRFSLCTLLLHLCKEGSFVRYTE